MRSCSRYPAIKLILSRFASTGNTFVNQQNPVGMKRIFILFLLFIICCCKIFAQQKLPDFGKIDIADLQMTECAFDKSADAMILFNDAKVTFETGIYGYTEVVTEKRVRIKIFNEKGFSAASISIPYINRSKLSKVRDVAACIYNLDDNGKIVVQKLGKDEILKDKSKTKYSEANYKFTFPNLKKSSVIEYRYTKSRKYSSAIPGWVFQDNIPTLYSNYSINLPGRRNIYYRIIGNLPVQRDSVIKKYAQSQFNESTRTFTMRNVPAFKAEPFMPPAADNIQRIIFRLTTGDVSDGKTNGSKWEGINASLIIDENFGKQFFIPVYGASTFLDSVTAIEAVHDKINAIFSFVKNNITWNGEQTLFAESVTDCWDTKTGSSAEMNILLFNMLHKAGVTCYPILVSTRSNGKPDMSFPSAGQFDGVDILALDEKENIYILDCTQKQLSYKSLPYNILNREAFLVDVLKNKWINITNTKPLLTSSTDIVAVVDSAGNVNGKAYMKLENVAKILDLVTNTTEKTSLLATGDENDIKIDSTEMQHDTDDNDTLIKKVQFHYTLSNAGSLYFINPFMFTMLAKNPFKDTLRAYDIDFVCSQSYKTSVRLLIPAGFTIDEVPKPGVIRTADSSMMFKKEYYYNENSIVIRTAFDLSRAEFSKEEYNAVHNFFDKVYAIISEQIVLKKKEE